MYHFNHKMMGEYWSENDTQLKKIDWASDLEGLSNVCYNNAPIWFNRLITKFQHKTLYRTLKMTGGRSGKKLLEIGCGTGRWIKFMKVHGAAVTGIDLQENKNRSSINNAEFICGNYLTNGFTDGSYDAILSVTVLKASAV